MEGLDFTRMRRIGNRHGDFRAVGLVLGLGRAAAVVGLSYAALWEGGQIALAGAGLADSLVDASAVAFGAALVAGAWAHRRGVLGAAMAGLAVMLVAGVGRRRGK